MLFSGHCDGSIHKSLWSTVPAGHLQPGTQSHVSSQAGTHSSYIAPPGHEIAVTNCDKKQSSSMKCLIKMQIKQIVRIYISY